jgi:hypothetical protein
MSTTTEPRATVRRLDTPTARELAGLASVFDDLRTVLGCCERLLAELSAEDPDQFVLEGLWTTTALSYGRCFARGRSGPALTERDITATELRGDVLEWHRVLLRMRGHYADPADNPREQFSVGVVPDSGGNAGGIAVTSTPQPGLDEVTVRQTGALAYALGRLVDRRISEQQERVREVAATMSAAELAELPLIELTGDSEPDR